MAMDVSQRANEIRNHRFDGYTNEMLASEVEVFRSGSGAGGIGEAVNALKAVGKALGETEQALRTELGKLGVEWRGDAGDQAFRWMTGQADFSEEARTKVEACAKKVFAQGEAFNRTVHKLPDAESLRQGSGGYGLMDSVGSLLGFETDNARRVAQGQEARAQALEALNGYAGASGENLSDLPQLNAPTSMSAVVSDVPTEVDAGGPPHSPDVTEVPAGAPSDDGTESAGAAHPVAPPAAPADRPAPVHHSPQPVQPPVQPGVPLAPPSGTGSAQPAPNPSTAPSSTTPSTSAPVTSSPNAGYGYVNVPRPGSSSGSPQYSGSPHYPGSSQSPGSPQYAGSTQYPGTAQPGGQGAAPGTPGAPSTGGAPGAVGKPATPGTPATPGSPATPGAPAAPGTPANPGTPATPGQPGGQSGVGKIPSGGGASPVAPAPGPVTGAPAPGSGGGAAVPPPGMVGGKAGAPVSGDQDLQKGKSFGVAPVVGGTAAPGAGGTTASPKAAGFGANDVGGAAGAVAAGGIAGALAGDSERGAGRGGAPRSPHQAQIGDLPEEQSRAQQNQTPKSEQDRRSMMQKAAPQEGDEDDTHVRRYGVDDKDLFADQRMVAPDTIGDPNAEQR